MKLAIVILLVCSPALAAQAGGLMPEWEVRELAGAIEKNTRGVANLLGQLKPADWVAQGAPRLYVDQLQQTRQSLEYLVAEAQGLSRQPEKLTAALDVFLRLDHVQSLFSSLEAGTRKYQNAPLADLLSSAASQNSTTRERLKEYIRQLAGMREQECEVAHREAQRCRGILAKQPPAPPAKKSAPPKQ
jgi:hypothetical protein